MIESLYKSETWKLITNKFIHLLAPLISGAMEDGKIKTSKRRTIEVKNKYTDHLFKLFKSIKYPNIKNKSPIKIFPICESI